VKTSIGSIRRQELEKAAYETACELGFKAMTLKSVAKHAGVSKGVIHHYFQSKDELINGMERHTNRLYAKIARERLKTARSASERIWAIVESNLVEGYTPNVVPSYLPVLVAGIHFEKLLRTYNAIDTRGRSNILYALKSLKATNELATSYTIWSMLEGAWVLSESQSQITRAALLQSIADYLKRIPGFDISVVDLREKSKSSDVQRTGRVALSTIRRMELEKAALEILYESGFRELTVQRVAERAQLSKGVVHHYFLSKDDLVAGALRHEFRQFGLAVAGLLARTSSPGERLWLVITAQLGDQYLQLSYLRWYMNSIEAGFRSEGITQVYDIAERRGRSNIAAALKELMPAAEARTTALVLWSMIEGSCYMMFSDRTITRKDVLLGIARYLTSSIPKFDSSVIVIDGVRADDRSSRSEATKSIALEDIREADAKCWSMSAIGS
jgi:TetR/AcrR family transcriptional repressor of bet genes